MIDEFLDEAKALREAKRYQEAVSVCEKAIALDEKDFRPHLLLGHIQIDAAKYGDAYTSFERAVFLNPENYDAQINFGMSLRDFGKFDQAREHFEKAIDLNPDFGAAYFNLSTVHKFEPTAPEIEKLEQIVSTDSTDTVNVSWASFALGRIYDELGEFDKAFANYDRGNKLLHKPYNHANTIAMLSRAKTVFKPSLFENYRGKGNTSKKPVFIIGMPRSGSTITEDILCRNNKIVGLSERHEVADIVTRLQNTHPSQTPYPEIVPSITSDQYRQLGELYFSLLDDLAGSAERMVDKNILNHSIAGFIRLMFSEATIIHTSRDPLETCLSCYFQNFSGGIEFSFDLHSLGHRYVAYTQFMEIWRECFGDSIVELKQENLINNKDREIEKLFDAVDMKVPDDVNTPADRAVITASSWQARQPIYNRTEKRWENYEKHLRPLFKAFKDAGFDYKNYA